MCLSVPLLSQAHKIDTGPSGTMPGAGFRGLECWGLYRVLYRGLKVLVPTVLGLGLTRLNGVSLYGLG